MPSIHYFIQEARPLLQRYLISIVLVVSVVFGFALTSAASISLPEEAPVSVLNLDLHVFVAGKPVYLILVEKDKQRLSVLEHNGRLRVLGSYRAATGEHDGPKEREGDEKTPEGIYFITKIYTDSKVTIFGKRAFHLNYPNVFDQETGKGGNGIFIHGTNKKLNLKSTNGCITLENKNLEEIVPFLPIESVPIIVVPSLQTLAKTSSVENIQSFTYRNFRRAKKLLLPENIGDNHIFFESLYMIRVGRQTAVLGEYRSFADLNMLKGGFVRSYLTYDPDQGWLAKQSAWQEREQLQDHLVFQQQEENFTNGYGSMSQIKGGLKQFWQNPDDRYLSLYNELLELGTLSEPQPRSIGTAPSQQVVEVIQRPGRDFFWLFLLSVGSSIGAVWILLQLSEKTTTKKNVELREPLEEQTAPVSIQAMATISADASWLRQTLADMQDQVYQLLSGTPETQEVLQQEIKRLEERLKELTGEMVHILEEQKQETSSHEQEIMEQQKQLVAAQNELVQVQRSCEQAEKRNSDRFKELEDTIFDASQTVDHLTKEKQLLTEEIETKTNQFQKEREESRKLLESEVSRIEKEAIHLRAELKRSGEFEQQLIAKEKQIAQLLQIHEKKVIEAQKTYEADRDHQTKERIRVQEDLQEERVRARQFGQELQEKQKAFDQLTDLLAKEKNMRHAWEEKAEQLISVDEELKEASKKVLETSDRLDKERELRLQREAELAEIPNIQARLAQTQEELVGLQSRFQDVMSQKEDLEAEIVELRPLEEKLTRIQKELLNKTIEQKEEEEKRHSLEEALSKLTEVEGRLLSQQKENEELRRENSRLFGLAQQADEWNQQLQEVQKRVLELESELESAAQKRSELDDELGRLMKGKEIVQTEQQEKERLLVQQGESEKRPRLFEGEQEGETGEEEKPFGEGVQKSKPALAHGTDYLPDDVLKQWLGQ